MADDGKAQPQPSMMPIELLIGLPEALENVG
jgi:hypothetical protein